MSVIDILSLVAAFAVTGWFMRVVMKKDRDIAQHEEDDARSFFDEHGHWPDERPEDAAARARRAADAEALARRSYRGG